MSLIISSTAVKITMDKLKRVCPSCRREQITPRGKASKAVRCKFCGKEIPPKK